LAIGAAPAAGDRDEAEVWDVGGGAIGARTPGAARTAGEGRGSGAERTAGAGGAAGTEPGAGAVVAGAGATAGTGPGAGAGIAAAGGAAGAGSTAGVCSAAWAEAASGAGAVGGAGSAERARLPLKDRKATSAETFKIFATSMYSLRRGAFSPYVVGEGHGLALPQQVELYRRFALQL
jgi:hypothetical protein